MPQSSRKNRFYVPLNWLFVTINMDAFIDLIVGKGLADQRHMLRYERSLSSGEMQNKAVKKIVFEQFPATNQVEENEVKSGLVRTKSLPGTIPEQGSVRPPVRRSRPMPETENYITPSGPPDLSCRDIPEEQLSRTYSRSSVWDPRVNPMPPMQEMQGFGRFRRSIYADAEWELNKFREELQTLGPVAIQHLGDFELAKLKVGVMDNIRSRSVASLTSYFDSGATSTAPRTYRGFISSRAALPTNPKKVRSKSADYIRDCRTSPERNEAGKGQWRPQPSRQSFLRIDPGQVPLATIEETTEKMQKKRSVPMIFDAGCTMEAMIDDDEYESCEESFAPAAVPVKADKHGTTTAAPKLNTKQEATPQVVLATRNRSTRHHRTADHVLEKARFGQKKANKPNARRLSSRGNKALVNRAVFKEHVPEVVDTIPVAEPKSPTPPNDSIPSLAIFSPKLAPTSSRESVEGDPVVEVIDTAVAKSPVRIFSENNTLSNCSEATSSQTMIPAAPSSSRFSKAQGRNRSNTAFRIHSGNIPIIYLEGEVKKATEVGEAKRANVQLVAV